MEQRTCRTCGEASPLDQFDRDARSPSGRRSECKPCRSVKMKAWYAANRERQCERQRVRFRDNREAIRIRDMERYVRHRDKRIALATQQAHKRALRLRAGEFDPTVTRAALRRKLGDCCAYCRVVMDFRRYTVATRPGNLASMEHVIPISRGGSHTWGNVVLACWRCNRIKNARDIDVWLEEAGADDPRRPDPEGEPRTDVA